MRRMCGSILFVDDNVNCLHRKALIFANLSVSPPPSSRLKYDNYQMDCHERCADIRAPQRMNNDFPDFPFSTTSTLKISPIQLNNYIYWICDFGDFLILHICAFY